MTVKVNNINDSQVKGYIYFVNNKVARVSEDSEVKISNLTKETQYNNIYVIAIDENGRFKRSSNTLEATTTSNYYARWKEYKSAQGTYENRYTAGRMQDSYGIGTHLTCDIKDVKPMNIVIKLTRMRITELREWHDCVKLSCDKGKTLGNPDKCAYLLRQIGG